MDEIEQVYNLNSCGICQNSGNLHAANISEKDRTTFLDDLKYIFPEMKWVHEDLINLICDLCVERILDIADFKRLCLDTNRRRGLFGDAAEESTTETIKIEIIIDDNEYNSSKNESTIMEEPTDEVITFESNSDHIETFELSDNDEEVMLCGRTNSVNTNIKRRGRPRKNPPLIYSIDNDDSITKSSIDPNILTEINDVNIKMSRYQPAFIPTKKERQCRVCKRKFAGWLKLKEHVDATHLKLRRYRCDICHMGFSGHDALNRHVYKHTGTRNYICAICGRTYITHGDLSEHLERHTEEAKYACAVCDVKFKTAGYLKTHASVHTDPKDYMFLCTVCGSKYPTSGGLSVHMQRHGTAKNVQCTKCDKRFFSNTDMTRHLVSHSDQRPFKCELCPDSYKLKHLLLMHKTRRHGIGHYSVNRSRNHQCTHCDKKFPSRTTLQRHIGTHTGDKPFKCRICNSQFNSKSYIRDHMKRRHNLDVEDAEFNLTDYYEVDNEVDIAEDASTLLLNGSEIFEDVLEENEEAYQHGQVEIFNSQVDDPQMWGEEGQMLEEEIVMIGEVIH